MSTFSEYIAKDYSRHERIVAGTEAAPPCYTCKQPSTHYGLTPGGAYAYECARHITPNEWRIDWRPLSQQEQ